MNGFGISLVPLAEENVELVRQWRNSQAIAHFMEFQGEISKEDQIAWFRSLECCHYFVIYAADTPCGLIDLKRINLDTKSAEAGLFIGEKQFMGTGIALGASVLLLDFAFDELQLEVVTAKVHKENREAIGYNQLIGFQKKEAMDAKFECWQLERTTYMKSRQRLVNFLS